MIADEFTVSFECSMRHARRGFFADERVFIEPCQTKRENELRRPTRGDELGDPLSGNRAGFESPGPPPDIQDKALDAIDNTHDGTVIRCHVANSAPLPQESHFRQTREQIKDMRSRAFEKR
jgi:hypothetical protein